MDVKEVHGSLVKQLTQTLTKIFPLTKTEKNSCIFKDWKKLLYADFSINQSIVSLG